MYVRGYLQGSENGRVVTIVNTVGLSSHIIYEKHNMHDHMAVGSVLVARCTLYNFMY